MRVPASVAAWGVNNILNNYVRWAAGEYVCRPFFVAILTFLGAGAGGVYLLMSIFVQDQKQARRNGPR